MRRSIPNIAIASVGTSLALALHHHPRTERVSVPSTRDGPTTTGDSAIRSSGTTFSERRAGRILFNACQSCHVGKPLGPPFWREQVCLLDKPAGSVYPDYPYTDILKNSGVFWNETSLDEFLKDPEAFIPGNYMIFQGIDDPTERQEMIAILKSFCDDNSTNVVDDDLTDVPSSSPTNTGDMDSSETLESSATTIALGVGFWIGPALLVASVVMGARRS